MLLNRMTFLIQDDDTGKKEKRDKINNLMKTLDLTRVAMSIPFVFTVVTVYASMFIIAITLNVTNILGIFQYIFLNGGMALSIFWPPSKSEGKKKR